MRVYFQSENTFQNIEQNATHIHFLNEEFLSAVGSEQVFVPNFLDLPKKLEENIIEKNAKLQLINQVKSLLLNSYSSDSFIFFRILLNQIKKRKNYIKE